MDSDRLDKALNELWERVASRETALPALEFPIPSPEGDLQKAQKEATQEAFKSLQERQEQDRLFWQELLELKEKNIEQLGERLRAAEEKLLSLHQEHRALQEHLFESSLESASETQEEKRNLEKQKEAHRQEILLLQDIAEEARKKLETSFRHLNALQHQKEVEDQERHRQILKLRAAIQAGEKREAELKREIQDWKSKLQELEKSLQTEKEEYERKLQEAKKALESTLGEFLKERQERNQAEQDKELALQKTEELENRLQEMKLAWEAERKQWRDLWDRERSLWETHRKEFATWEERLRREREVWHRQLRGREDMELQQAAQMTRILENTTHWILKVTAVLKHFAIHGVEHPQVITTVQPIVARSKRSRLYALAAPLALLILAGAGWLGYKNLYLGLHPKAAYSLAAPENPTALAWDGSRLWIADWSGSWSALAPEKLPESRGPASFTLSAGAYHPVALAYGAGAFWSADAGQGRILKHDPQDPSKILAEYPSPGPSPIALGFRGEDLWSFDALSNKLSLHSLQNPQILWAERSLPEGISPAAFQWQENFLWILDVQKKKLLQLKALEKTFQIQRTFPLQIPWNSFVFAGPHTLWALSEGKLLQYRLR
ncbi:MAG: hypothetical protein HY402_07190 [Elusimicrobia bacterium]|nr:hypothetical protein [Elusimicrobiota bacterium]